MIYSKQLIDKILNYKTISKRGKIDRMLAVDANQYWNLGIDSTNAEKKQVWQNSKYIYQAIKKINNELGSKFLLYQDKK